MENPGKGGQKLTGFLGTVDFVEAMDHALVSSSKLVLIESSLEVLIVSDDDFAFFLTDGAPFFGTQLRLGVDVHSTVVLVIATTSDNVFENSRDDLLSSPTDHRLNHSRSQDMHLGESAFVQLLAETSVHELHIIFFLEEAVLVG